MVIMDARKNMASNIKAIVFGREECSLKTKKVAWTWDTISNFENNLVAKYLPIDYIC